MVSQNFIQRTKNEIILFVHFFTDKVPPKTSQKRRPKSPSLGRRLTRKIIGVSTHHKQNDASLLQSALIDEDIGAVEKLLLGGKVKIKGSRKLFVDVYV